MLIKSSFNKYFATLQYRNVCALRGEYGRRDQCGQRAAC